MATITKKSNGKYQARYRDGGGTWRRKTFTLKKDAEKFVVNVSHAVQNGRGVDESKARLPLKVFAAEWFAAQPDTPHTRQNKRNHLNNHLIPALGDRPIGSITHLDMQKYVTQLAKSGLAANSIHHIVSTAKTLFRDARRIGIVVDNPCVDLRLPPVQKKQLIPAEISHIHAVMAEMSPRLRAAVLFAAGTGLRPAEMFAIKLEDIHFEPKKSTVLMRRQVHSYTGEPQKVVDRSKTYRDRRVPLADGLVEVLNDHIERFPPDKNERFIFTNTVGRPLHHRVFNRAWLRARRKVAARIRAEAQAENAGNPMAVSQANAVADFLLKLRFYDLRHFYGSLLIGKGASLKVVQELLGHTTSQMTMNHYVHLAPGDTDIARKATKKLFKIH